MEEKNSIETSLVHAFTFKIRQEILGQAVKWSVTRLIKLYHLLASGGLLRNFDQGNLLITPEYKCSNVLLMLM